MFFWWIEKTSVIETKKKYLRNWDELHRSFWEMEKRKGPKILPCGTPLSIGNTDEQLWPVLVNSTLIIEWLLFQAFSYCRIPYEYTLRMRHDPFIESNLSVKSKNLLFANSPFSKLHRLDLIKFLVTSSLPNSCFICYISV